MDLHGLTLDIPLLGFNPDLSMVAASWRDASFDLESREMRRLRLVPSLPKDGRPTLHQHLAASQKVGACNIETNHDMNG